MMAPGTAAVAAVHHKPTTAAAAAASFRYAFPRRHLFDPRKPTSLLQFPPLKSAFPGGLLLGSKKVVSKTMTELVKTSAIRSRDADETGGILQEEALVDRSSTRLPAAFIPNYGLEATLNLWVQQVGYVSLFGVLVLLRHDAEAMWIVAGAVLNTILSKTLKQILNQERPVSTSRSDPGMPSSHAQSIFFISSFAVVTAVEWLGINEVSLLLSAIALACGSYFSWLRVSRQLHTISQVLVGAVVGTAFFILWYWSWNGFVHEAFNSYLWVRILVALGAAAFCLGFLSHVVRHWFSDDDE